MQFFELDASNISDLTDADLRELVARLSEAELIQQRIQPSCVFWGGAQEAADGGLDVRIRDANTISNPAYIPRENTGFQVKKNSMSKSACSKEMLDKGKIKPVIQELADAKGAYIIVSGKDDCSDKMLESRREGMLQPIEGLLNKEHLAIDFYGRDRLSGWLRQHPGVSLWVRSKIGKPLHGWRPFGRWAATPIGDDDEFLNDEHPCVIDYNSLEKKAISLVNGINLTREKLRENGACVRITGLSGVGKTRFSQALFEPEVGDHVLPASNVIYADLGENLLPSASELVTYLIANNFTTYLVLDNCPPDVHRTLQQQVSTTNSKLRLLTVEYDISDDRPEETKVIHLEPSSEQTVSALVQKRHETIGRVNADKIAKFSGGNSRVALALASRVESDETLTNFSDEQLFQRLFSQRQGFTDSLLEGAEALSLVYSINISSSEYNNELDTLGKIVGSERRQLLRNNAELLRRHLSQKRGNWRAILPHALANRLARRGLESIEIKQINNELFKPENIRLLKSCAHRLGYLHDSPPAHDLANSWLKPDGPLYDLSSYDEDLVTILKYIAPVLPDTILSVIEAAAEKHGFATRENKHFITFVRLLINLAYEDQSFDRCAAIILKFSETEDIGENYNSIVSQFKQLFALRLSGTHATPERRQAFIKKLLKSGKRRHLEIAQELLDAAFESSYWTSSGTFDFGARSRDFGWQPANASEAISWYTGHIELLKPLLISRFEKNQKWAKTLLANHFRELWVFAGCNDYLEGIIKAHGENGKWPEMWLSVKKTIHFDSKRLKPEIYEKLVNLEKILAPNDPFTEIQAYALTDTWKHSDLRVRGRNYREESETLHEKISKLGEIAATDPNYLKELSSQLWEKYIDALIPFGEGIATGSYNKVSTFEMLVELMQDQQNEEPDPTLFIGFIVGVNKSSPDLVKTILEITFDVPELKKYLVNFLTCIPLSGWSKSKLIALAKSRELESWRFEHIRNGRIHEQLSDKELAEIIRAINNLDYGVISSIRILGMRFHIEKNDEYKPSDEIISIGRNALLKLLSLKRNKLSGRSLYNLNELKLVSEFCLDESSPLGEIQSIIESHCDAISSFNIYAIDIEDITYTICKNFPEMILDHVLLNRENTEFLKELVLKEFIIGNLRPLDYANIERIVGWCSGDQERIQKVAEFISAYVPLNDKNNPEMVVLSEHIKHLLEISTNKPKILETIKYQAYSTSGDLTDSRSKTIEARANAFSELLKHPDPEVNETAEIIHLSIMEEAKEQRRLEKERNNREEQRFE